MEKTTRKYEIRLWLDDDALDALEHRDGNEAPNRGEAEGFLRLALENRATPRQAVALGRDLRFDGNGSEGSGLEIDGELVQLSAFPSEGQGPNGNGQPGVTRVRRPSQRRR